VSGTASEGAYQQCFAALESSAGVNGNELDQGQNLVWAVHHGLKDGSGNNLDSLMKARVKLTFRFWYGYYQNDGVTPLRCIKLTSDSLFMVTKTDPNGIGGSYQLVNQHGSLLRHVNPSGGIAWCAGTTTTPIYGGAPPCDTHYAASLRYRAEFRFYRHCYLDEEGWNGAPLDPDWLTNGLAELSDIYSLGGVPALSSAWEYQMWAITPSGSWFTPGMAGWWTTLDYGGGVWPYTNGWRTTGPPLWTEGGRDLCDHYATRQSTNYPVEVTNGSGGRVNWKGPYHTGSGSPAWPGTNWP
jgi:hypothetical protein